MDCGDKKTYRYLAASSPCARAARSATAWWLTREVGELTRSGEIVRCVQPSDLSIGTTAERQDERIE